MLAFSLYILKKNFVCVVFTFSFYFFLCFSIFYASFYTHIVEQPIFFSVCSSIQFFNSFLWLTRHYVIPLVNTLISHNLCDLQETISHYWSPLSLPIQPLPTEAENFPRVFKHPKHVLLPIYLAYLLPKSTSW